MDLREKIYAQLTGPGGPFEVAHEDVLGERLPVLVKRPGSLRQLLADSQAHGDAEHIVQGERRIGFAEHLRLVASASRALSERYGIGKGDVVGILAANCAEWPMAFWATVSLGGVVSSMNGFWTADEIRYAVEKSRPKLLIGDRKRLERIEGLGLDVPTLVIEDEFEALLAHAPGAELPSTPIAEDDPAVILFTSGTTGRPKGAVASHRGVIGFVQVNILHGLLSTMVEAQTGDAIPDPTPPSQQVTLMTSPMFHLSGLYAGIVFYLFLGGKLVIRTGRFDPADVLRLIEKERVTLWGALGAMGPRVANHPDVGRYDLSSVRNVGFGGAPASPAVQELMRRTFPSAGMSLGIGYGSSETVSVVASTRGREFARNPESTGRIMPMTEVEIRDESGAALGEGAEGEIHVRSPFLMLGYWDDPEATAGTLGSDRWLATGDIGRIQDGFLFINSRARDMILRSAENVYPVEIEYRLEEHPDVREAAVVGIDHPELGQEVKAIVVAEPGRSPDTEKLAAWCAETLAAYKVPSLWEVRDEPLPRNPSGKVLKNVLTGEASLAFVEEGD